MSVCPNCQAEIPDEFGLMACTKCGSNVFVDVDGSVSMSDDMEVDLGGALSDSGDGFSDEAPEGFQFDRSDIEGAADEEMYGTGVAPSLESSLVQEAGELDLPEEESHEPVVESNSVILPPVPSYEEQAEDHSELQTEEPVESYMDEPEPAVEEQPLIMQSQEESSSDSLEDYPIEELDQQFEEGMELEPEQPIEGSGAYVMEEEPPQTGADGLEEIKDFGNSDVSSATEGSLKLRVRISCIDDPTLRKELREALTDRRFLWNVDELMASIKSGELVILGLSPVKASVLINRLKPINLRVYWEQYAIQMDSQPTSPSADPVGEL